MLCSALPGTPLSFRNHTPCHSAFPSASEPPPCGSQLGGSCLRAFARAAPSAVQHPPLRPSTGKGILWLCPLSAEGRDLCVTIGTSQYVGQNSHRKPCWMSEGPVWLREERQDWSSPRRAQAPRHGPHPVLGREAPLDFSLEACFCTWENQWCQNTFL